ncbi:MAG: metallophosphoesterase, partial [Janthinobacterium lividum]
RPGGGTQSRLTLVRGSGMRRRFLVICLMGAAGLAAFVVAGWREAVSTPRVVRYDVSIPGWPPGQPPLRIVQLSDTHFGAPDMTLDRLTAIVKQANALRPDLVVLTGDYHGGKLYDYAAGHLDDAVRPFRELRSRYGTFAVRGNHDEAHYSPIVIPRYRITYLQNSWADAGPLIIAGLDDLSTGTPDIAAALRNIPPGKPVILLMHEPDSFPAVPSAIPLSFAGHTHGGQIVLPLIGALTTNSIYGNRFRRGLISEKGHVLIVSSGVGASAVPLRIGVPPEIVVVTLHGAGPYSVGRKSGTDR